MKKMAFDHYDLLYCFFFTVCVIRALGQVWRKVCIYLLYSPPGGGDFQDGGGGVLVGNFSNNTLNGVDI